MRDTIIAVLYGAADARLVVQWSNPGGQHRSASRRDRALEAAKVLVRASHRGPGPASPLREGRPFTEELSARGPPFTEEPCLHHEAPLSS